MAKSKSVFAKSHHSFRHSEARGVTRKMAKLLDTPQIFQRQQRLHLSETALQTNAETSGRPFVLWRI